MERITLFAELIFPIPVEGSFTYRIPLELNELVQVGMRVVVQFGKKKVYTALVRSIHEIPPTTYASKYVLAVLDEKPIVNEKQFVFWEWMADYYMCTLGEVMNAALPGALKLASESKVVLSPEFDGDYKNLNEKEYLIVEALEIQKVLSISDVENISELKKVFPLIKTLIEKKVILLEEELKEKYIPKIETYVQLADDYQSDEALKPLFDQLEKRAYKQLEILIAYLNLSSEENDNFPEIKKSILINRVENGASAYAALEKKGVFVSVMRKESRLQTKDAFDEVSNIELSEVQAKALEEIKTIFTEKEQCLLHGITGSGKTEIYIKLIADTIAQGKQVLYLLPEIALTAQIINRLSKYFGKRVGVYHSRYNQNEQVEIWNKVLDKEDYQSDAYDIILSARSGIFLPYSNLGLIVVDEEHDTSYKQQDPAPRYHARDAALVLAHRHGAKALMGTATPSVESYYNARRGKYGLVNLLSRFGESKLPEVLVADIKVETRRKMMRSHFSSFLLKHIETALENNEQVILFQNRRGFSPRLECEVCNWIPECVNCDISLVYHKQHNRLKCHICGYSTAVPTKCGSCGSSDVKMRGFGTEKVEEDLAIILPKAKIKRMDLDTTRSKYAYEQIFKDFEERNIDILIGTQMVTKGLDFDNVGIVGVLNADNMLNYPDFRAFERSFQMMVQVSGRAGRKNKTGKVIIQTYSPYHSVIRYVINNDYQEMYASQILERRNFHYPPFYRLIKFSLKHKDFHLLNNAAQEFTALLRKEFGNAVLGPEYPMVSRVRGLFLKDSLLKLPKDKSNAQMKVAVKKCIKQFRKLGIYNSARLIIDVDPY
ncbi:MAG: primosomal protein N' [Bacteroidales bacterium]|nr:primosomal protein N' [Bacteroidales bacterium]